MKPSIRLFYVSAPEDAVHVSALKSHLKILQDRKLILGWHDELLSGGEDLAAQIDAEFAAAEIILLLVSSDYMASQQCQRLEERALLRHCEGSAMSIPIIVRDVLWKVGALQALQALPPSEKPITKWPDQDEAWRRTAEGIRRVAEVLRA